MFQRLLSLIDVPLGQRQLAAPTTAPAGSPTAEVPREVLPGAPPSDKTLRLPQLDAVRGLAALAVFWGHAFSMMRKPPGILQVITGTPLQFFFDGQGAVLLFFVLSGFVLNLKYLEPARYPAQWAGSFLIRRVLRIYPAFFASVCLALLLRALVPTGPPVFSNWFTSLWQAALSHRDVLWLLTLVGPNIHPDPINPPLWSLVMEMRISLLFPLIILLVNRRRGLAGDGLIVLLAYAGCCALFLQGSATSLFVPQFVLGAMCVRHCSRLQAWLGSLKTVNKAIWLIGCICVYETLAMAAHRTVLSALPKFWIQQVVGLGAAGLILGSVSFVRLRTGLTRPALQFVGYTSYSFYLIHLVLLLAFGSAIFRAFHSYVITWVSILAVSYLVAHLFFQFIERPGMRLGHLLAERFKQSASGVAAKPRQ
jgi:peptidoglycan/LPS O-acetylase OafA/YrhL